MDLRHWRGLSRKGRAEARAYLIRDHLPYGKFADAGHIAEHVVEHPVGLLAKGRPVGRIERASCDGYWIIRCASAAHSLGSLVFCQSVSIWSTCYMSNRNAISHRAFSRGSRLCQAIWKLDLTGWRIAADERHVGRTIRSLVCQPARASR
jgi:hypothetical protein